MAFLGRDYLIGNSTGMALFDRIRDLPVVDPHNHANVREIAENRNYSDAWQLFAATDHYVWEMLRKRGVPESCITGTNASNEENFWRWRSFPNCRQPVYVVDPSGSQALFQIDTSSPRRPPAASTGGTAKTRPPEFSSASLLTARSTWSDSPRHLSIRLRITIPSMRQLGRQLNGRPGVR